jgi:hypothetical protein
MLCTVGTIDRLAGDVDIGEDLADRKCRAALQHLRSRMIEVQEDVILLLPTPRPSRIWIVMERETTSRSAEAHIAP